AALPGRRFADAITDEGDEERRRAADREHPPPAVARADRPIGQRGEKESEVVAGVHVAAAGLAAILRPFLRDERTAHRPFAADADAGEEAQRRQLPAAGDDAAQQREE